MQKFCYRVIQNCNCCSLLLQTVLYAIPTLLLDIAAVHFIFEQSVDVGRKCQLLDRIGISFGFFLFFLMAILQLLSIIKCYEHIFIQGSVFEEEKSVANQDFHFALCIKFLSTVYTVCAPAISDWPLDLFLAFVSADLFIFFLTTVAPIFRIFQIIWEMGKEDNDKTTLDIIIIEN